MSEQYSPQIDQATSQPPDSYYGQQQTPVPQSAPDPASAAVEPWVPKKKDSAFKRGFGVGFGFSLGAGIVLVILTVISLISSIIMMSTMTSLVSASDSNYATIWGPSNASNNVRAINISGTIYATGTSSIFASAGTFGYEVAAQIDAIRTEDAAGLLLLMDTPGGSINGSKAISDAVDRYQERTGKKVVAYVEGTSASGGVYSMAHADHIIADFGTLIGSIGVIMGPFEHYNEVTGLTGTILSSGVTTTGGITVDYITAGTGKDFGNPFRAMTDEELANYQNGINVEYDKFVAHVAAGRPLSEERIRTELGAFMFDPHTAIEKGLVDEVLGRDEAFRRTAELFGVDPADTRIVQPAMPGAWGSLFGIEQRIYGHTAPQTADSVLAPNPLCAAAPGVFAFAGDLTVLCGS